MARSAASARGGLRRRILDVDVELLALPVDLAQPALLLHLDAQLLEHRLLRDLALARVERERVAGVLHVGAARGAAAAVAREVLEGPRRLGEPRDVDRAQLLRVVRAQVREAAARLGEVA